jgi:predicted DNA-binding helix-hairpin-helix protein
MIILKTQYPQLEVTLDPKTSWALRHLEFFPVEVNRADYEQLLRIPGIGLKSAARILAARRLGGLNLDHLGKLGVVMRRAKYFLTCQGKFLERQDDELANPPKITGVGITAAPATRYRPVTFV